MPSVDPAAQEAALPFRVYALEQQSQTQDAALSALNKTTSRHSEAISAQAVTLAHHEEKLGGTGSELSDVKSDVKLLAGSVVTLGEKVAASSSRIAWTLTAFAFTTAGSVIALILTRQPG